MLGYFTLCLSMLLRFPVWCEPKLNRGLMFDKCQNGLIIYHSKPLKTKRDNYFEPSVVQSNGKAVS